jgi:protein DEK
MSAEDSIPETVAAAPVEEKAEEVATTEKKDEEEAPKKVAAEKATPKKSVAPPAEGGRRSAREKTEVKVFTIEVAEKEDKDLEIAEGLGEELGNIENVEHRLGAIKSADPFLKQVHRLLFPGQRGVKKDIKAHIRKFKGFAEGDDEAKTKAQEYLETLESGKALKPMCQFFDLNMTGKKEELVERIMDFIVSPESSGGAYKTARKAGGAKRKAPSKKSKKETKEKVAKPLSGYFFYCGQIRAATKKKHPDAPVSNLPCTRISTYRI